jgi:hypothetical protein
MIRFDSPLLRLIIWPLYSIWEFGFIFFVGIGTFFILKYFDVDNYIIITLGGMAGAWVMMIWSAPSNMIAGQDEVRKIEEALAAMEYVRTERGWVPPLPRFLRWPHNRLEILDMNASSFLVRGPRSLLSHLRSAIDK